jgi:glycosyltransferase involved in cell wall biosynthesis
MALRLTDAAASRLTPSTVGQTPAPSTAPADLLVARADAHLAGRDFAGYLSLFTEAAGIEDVHRRYQARKRLLETGLAARGSSVATAGPVFLAVARAALTVLEEDPCEPSLLTYAGVAFYELGELPAAEALFSAALRLDPELPLVGRNLEEIARRRRAGITSLGLPGPLVVALKELAPRAKRVAQAARPATDKRISLCMIVKDEEAMLGRSLAAARPFVDEIIVVDTGSTDRTVAIAEEHGARVLHHTWTGDFAEARNVSLEAATGDWIVYLDADEVVVDGDGPRLRELAGRTWREAFYLVFVNHTGDLEDGTAVQFNAPRMFRNRAHYRFEGRLHEQYAQHLPGYLRERFEVSQVRIDHFGYLGVVRDGKAKSERNIALLRQQIAEGAEGPFVHFNMGSELAAAGDTLAALEEFRTAWRIIDEAGDHQRLGFAASLSNRLLTTLRVSGLYDEAWALADQILEHYPGYTDIVLHKALIAGARGQFDLAEELLHECMRLGDAPSKYTPTVGSGTYLAMLTLADIVRGRGRLDEAERLVRRCLAEHPTFLGIVEPYASVRIAAGADPAEVAAEVEQAVPDLSPGARFMLAVALHEAQAPAVAEPHLRAVVQARPDSEPARLALAETLLVQGRFADVADVIAPIAADSPWAPAAELLRAPIAAWRASVAGEPVAPLPAEAADVLVRMLDGRARAEDFDAFEALVPCLDAVALSARERSERLAALYLRNGFLDMAADEWIVACEQDGPDARAMIGLAQIAWARGLDEEATAFAQEAQALSPGHPGAAALLADLATPA